MKKLIIIIILSFLTGVSVFYNIKQYKQFSKNHNIELINTEIKEFNETYGGITQKDGHLVKKQMLLELKWIYIQAKNCGLADEFDSFFRNVNLRLNKTPDLI